jgi:hypothetical protein
MRIIRSLIVIMALGAAAGAQQTKKAPALPAKPVETVSPAKSPANRPPVARDEKETVRPAQKKSAEAYQAEEEGSVMIDAKAEEDVRSRASDNEPEAEEAKVAGGIPVSYGQLKGTLNEGGKGFLVFENEDGVISLVQIITGKDTVSWKLVSKIPRSAD